MPRPLVDGRATRQKEPGSLKDCMEQSVAAELPRVSYKQEIDLCRLNASEIWELLVIRVSLP